MYADILVVLNIIVDYFLLSASSKIIKKKISVIRIILGAVIGGVSSLYIFLPNQGVLFELFYKFSTCALMVLVTFSFVKIKTFLRNLGILFLVTCGYGGLMIAVWYIFKPNGMLINNSVVYFDISPLILISASIVTYFLFVIFSLIFSKSAKLSQKCEIIVFAEDESIRMTGMVDTGNSIEDIFGGSEVIIADKCCVKELFGNIDITSNSLLKSRYRVMPCGTISGNGVLEGFRCDKAIVNDGKKTVKLNKPILAISKISLNDDYSAIVNPKIFMQ